MSVNEYKNLKQKDTENVKEKKLHLVIFYLFESDPRATVECEKYPDSKEIAILRNNCKNYVM